MPVTNLLYYKYAKYNLSYNFFILPGFGVSTASIFLRIFSVHVLVAFALSARCSKCASNSVFSDVPNVSSVN